MNGPSLNDVAIAFRVIAAHYEAQAQTQTAQRQTQPAQDWLAQSGSPAGRRRHIGECRRLVATGSDQAQIIGRKYLLTREAVNALLARITGKRSNGPDARRPVQLVDELEGLRAKLEGRIQ